jgi:hypothetical protein
MNYDYNTIRTHLILPEYGRNIQQMINHIKTIENREERNKAAKTIVHIMGNMNPQMKDSADARQKLWDQLAIIADFELDIDWPIIPPKKEELYEKPSMLEINQKDIQYKHYGRMIEKIIEKAVTMEDGEEKNALILITANHMKKSYLKWNREAVSDEQILEDMKFLSKGRLVLSDSLKLNETKEILNRTNNNNNNLKNKKRNFQRSNQK